MGGWLGLGRRGGRLGLGGRRGGLLNLRIRAGVKKIEELG